MEGCPADPERLELRHQVVMFTDVHSFSIVGVELGSRLPAFVQDYFHRMGEEITHHHGQIIKYLGDSLLAVFPESREEDAVTSALCMRLAYGDLVSEYDVTTETELEVGIAAGTVAAGTFGHPSTRRRCPIRRPGAPRRRAM